MPFYNYYYFYHIDMLKRMIMLPHRYYNSNYTTARISAVISQIHNVVLC